MRRLDPNPDINELMNYSGVHPRVPSIPDTPDLLPTPKGLVPRPYEYQESALWWALPVGASILMLLAIFAPALFR